MRPNFPRTPIARHLKLALLLLSPTTLHAYTYYYSETTNDPTKWVSNGDVTTATGGSKISNLAVPDSTLLYEIRTTLNEQITQLKEQADPALKLPTANLPHQQARRQDEQDRDGPLSSGMGASAVGGLEAQIGGLSMQYHSLLLQLASAKGRRASQIKSQLMALEQKLSALNLELEKKRIQAKDSPKPTIT